MSIEKYDRNGEISDHLHFKETVTVAVSVELAPTDPRDAGFRVLLGIPFDDLHPIATDMGDKRNRMFFGHGMIHRDIVFVFDEFHADAVSLVGGFRFQRRQMDPAAADLGVAGGENHIAAEGADIKASPLHIGGAIAVFHPFAPKQLRYGNTEGRGQRCQQRNIGQTFASFP